MSDNPYLLIEKLNNSDRHNGAINQSFNYSFDETQDDE